MDNELLKLLAQREEIARQLYSVIPPSHFHLIDELIEVAEAIGEF